MTGALMAPFYLRLPVIPDQFMIYHLYEWDDAKRKWKKKPVGLAGESLPLNGGIPTTHDRNAVAATCARLGPQYHVGLWLAPASNFFFVDLDEAVIDGILTPEATAIVAPLVAAGCYFEPSSSGRGAHVIGRYSGILPPHANRRPLVHSHEFYVRDRGCVLSTGATQGSWHVDATALLVPIVSEYFPPRITSELMPVGVGPRADWRGPADDDVLIARMLAAAGSAAARLGGKLTLSQLWKGDAPHDSESDMALASHLAFWTGCDPVRIERLMRRSGLRRDKWDEHRTYLREKTITIACATTVTVYAEPVRVDVMAKLTGSATAPQNVTVQGIPGEVLPAVDWYTLTDTAIASVNNSGNFKDLIESVVPVLQSYSLPPVHRERVAVALHRRLELFNAKQSIATVRTMLTPPVDHTVDTAPVVPEWAQSLVYNLANDKYYDTSSGYEYSERALKASFSRYMPLKQSGGREDPAEWLSNRWQVQLVNDLEYRPDMAAVFQQGNRSIANTFLPSSMPTPVAGSAECIACIELFQQHLADITSRRPAVYAALLGWIAHNVQRPGVKIRWAPLIKGVGGDGKSIIADLMFAAMGEDNVKITSPSTIANSGGFTDWATGRAVNFIEEIRLEGKERRKLYNSMKTIVGDDRNDINRKGRASGRTSRNVMNHAAFSNYGDAMPLDDTDRRWNIIFTPWETATQAAAIKQLGSVDDLPRYFQRLGSSMRAEPGAWRAWLSGIDLSAFDPNSRALQTAEREAMHSGSEDYIEQTIRDVIIAGGAGITVQAFCSSSLMGRVQIALGESPDKRSWNRILTDIGYRQVKPMWWNNKTRRIWVKSTLDHEQILEILNKSAFPPLL